MMNDLIFAVLILLPSVILCFVIFSTFYGARLAYLATCWVPVGIYLSIEFIVYASGPEINRVNFDLMLQAVAWTGLLQGMLGIGIMLNAFAERKSIIALVPAILLTVIPILLLSSS